MIKPKQGLHTFARLYQAKSTPAEARPKVFGAFASDLAAANVVHEDEALALQKIQQNFSINTLEELAAIARIDSREKTTLMKDTGLPPHVFDRVLGIFQRLDTGKEILAEMERYETFKYELGCELDFDSEPPGQDYLQPASFHKKRRDHITNGCSSNVGPKSSSFVPKKQRVTCSNSSFSRA